MTRCTMFLAGASSWSAENENNLAAVCTGVTAWSPDVSHAAAPTWVVPSDMQVATIRLAFSSEELCST